MQPFIERRPKPLPAFQMGKTRRGMAAKILSADFGHKLLKMLKTGKQRERKGPSQDPFRTLFGPYREGFGR